MCNDKKKLKKDDYGETVLSLKQQRMSMINELERMNNDIVSFLKDYSK